MKDITIKASTLKREFKIFLGFFALTILINLYAIVTRDGELIELITQIGWTVLIALIFYVLVGLIRGIINGVKHFKNEFVN